MTPPLNWEEFRKEFVEPRRPRAQQVSGRIPAVVFVSEQARRIGIRFPIQANQQLPRSPLRQISIETHADSDGAPVLEIATGTEALFKQFFLFAMDVVHAVHEQGAEVVAALDAALSSWRRLLQAAARLSEAEEIGLLGELLVLERLVTAHGTSGFKSWVGPLGEPHDFRLPAIELEVKTTTSVVREHMINGWHQLIPAPGLDLYLLSIQLEPAAAADGRSVESTIRAIQQALDPASRLTLETLLQRRRIEVDSIADYGTRFRARREQRLIPVDSSLPRITADRVDLPADQLARIDDIHYRLNIEGLGWREGSPDFERLLGVGHE